MTTEMLEAARRYVACGLSVIPIRKYSKHPDHAMLKVTTGEPINYEPSDARAIWRVYCQHMPTEVELVRWFRDSDCGIGIVGGAISGGLVRLDFESPACLPTWYELLNADPVLGCAAATLPVVQTAKGHHVYFRTDDPPGHEVLCAHGSGDEMIVLSETQGEGCYCLAPPTPITAWTDAVGQTSYLWCGIAGPESIPTLDGEIAQKLIAAARFPGFWQPTFAASWGPRHGEVTRAGLSLRTAPEREAPGLWLDWPHLSALREYLSTYEALLKAVETAPPPPPSYNNYVDDDDHLY